MPRAYGGNDAKREVLLLKEMKEKKTLKAICGDRQSRFRQTDFPVWVFAGCDRGLHGGARGELIANICNERKCFLPTLTVGCR